MAGKRWAIKNARRVFDYLLEHPCVDCGEPDPVVLDFDHRVPGEKSFNICVRRLDTGWDKIKAEIDKCDVRCANCHRRRTARQFDWHKLTWYTEYLKEQARLA